MNVDFNSILQSPAFGLVLAPVVTKVVDFVKGKSNQLDGASPLVKQSVVALAGFAAAVGTHFASNGAVALTPDVVQTAIVAVLGAVAVKHGQQNSNKTVVL